MPYIPKILKPILVPKCPKCGAYISNWWTSCERCGAALKPQKKLK